MSEGGDGLADDWSGRAAYVNPPFSPLLKWLRRAHEQWQAGMVGTVICLVPVRTDSAWFHETLSADADIYLLRGRIRFLDTQGKGQHTPFSLMVLTLGANVEQKTRIADLRQGSGWHAASRSQEIWCEVDWHSSVANPRLDDEVSLSSSGLSSFIDLSLHGLDLDSTGEAHHVPSERRTIMTGYRKTDEAIAALTPEQFRVTQRNGTERPGTGALLRNKEAGVYVDVVSGAPLFASADKYESGCGWPSFTKPIEPANVNATRDWSTLITPDRGALDARRQSPWPRLQGRSAQPRRPTLRHQLGIAALRAARHMAEQGHGEYLHQIEEVPSNTERAVLAGGCF